MKIRLFVAAIFLFICAEYSLACGNYPVMSTKKEDGAKVGIVIPETTIKSTPEWSPVQGEPPLSISTVFRIVKDWSKHEYARYDDIAIRQISLREYGCTRHASRWFYIVDFQPVIDGNKLWGTANWVAVLLDGTVIGVTNVDK
jgi:hypothetical protein